MDIKPDKKNRNHIKCRSGIHQFRNLEYITSVFPVLSYRPSLCDPYDVFRCHLNHAFHILFTGRFKIPNTSITLQSKEKMCSIDGTENFILNAAYTGNRFPLSLQWHGGLMFCQFSFLIVAMNVTKKDIELTQVQDKNCIGTVIISCLSLLSCLTSSSVSTDKRGNLFYPAQGRIQFNVTGPPGYI